MLILDEIKNSKAVKSLDNESEGVFVVDDILQFTFAISSSFLNKKRKMLVVAPNLYSAQNIYEQLSSFVGEDNILFYPFDEVIRIDKVSSSKEMLSQRLYVMSECLKNENKILITHTSASLRKLTPKNMFKNNIISLEVGKSYDVKRIVGKLLNNGFSKVSKIDQTLQFALRGDILDIYPINSDFPYRIEFFDDEVESIRILDIASQRSSSSLDSIYIYPSNELLYDKEDYENIKTIVLNNFNEQAKHIDDYEIKDKLYSKIRYELEKIKENGFDETLYPYFNYENDNHESIIDYFNADSIIIYSFDKLIKAYDFCIEELNLYFEELFRNGLSLKNPTYFFDLSYLLDRKHIKTNPYITSEFDYSLPIRSVVHNNGILIKSIPLINEYLSNNKKVLVCMDKHTLKIYEDYLISENVEYYKSENGETYFNKIGLFEFDFKEGFELIEQDLVVLTKKELMGYRSFSNRYISRYKKAEILNSYEDLLPGDYVVHEENGIGQFVKIDTINDINDEPKDYLKIMYRDENILYVCKRMDRELLFQTLSQELANIEMRDEEQSNIKSFKSYCISYMICKKYGIDVSNYNFENLPEEIMKN